MSRHSSIIHASFVHAGHVVFHGPREDVLPFFSSLGFQLPERKGIADFLQEVTSKKDQRVKPLEPSYVQYLCWDTHNLIPMPASAPVSRM